MIMTYLIHLLTASNLRFCLCLMLVFYGSSICKSQTSYFYTSEKLLSSRVTCIEQDADGYIWIGTDCGLNKFDGYRFTEYVYQHGKSKALKSNFITCLFNDQNGQFWVGTSKGLMKYDKFSDSFDPIETDDHENPHIASVAFYGRNQFYVGTAGYGLYRWNSKTNQLVSCNKTFKSADNFFSRLYLDQEGYLWKSGLNDRISRFSLRHPQEQILKTDCGLPTAFLPLGKDFLLVGLRKLLLYHDKKLNGNPIDMSLLSPKPSNFRTAIKDKQGNIYIGSYGQGLFIIPKGTHQMHRVPSPTADFDLSTANIYALFLDKEDNIWVGCHRKGLLMIPSRKAQFHTWRLSTQNYAVGASISSACEGDNGITWCVIQNVGVCGFDNYGRIIAHPSCPKNPYCIYRDHQGQYWIGTDTGLYSYNPLTGSYNLQTTIQGEYVRNIVDGRNGKLYLSVGGHGFLSFDKQTKQTTSYQMKYGEKNALCNNWIYTMRLDHRGLLWIGTASGISCFDPKSNTFRKHADKSLAYSLVCISLAELRNGDIAIGADNGLYLYKYKTGEIVPFPNSSPMVGKMVMSVLPMTNGDLWCSSSYGIWHYQEKSKKLINYLHATGMATREYIPEIGYRRQDGYILFGINDGLTLFNPSLLHQLKWHYGEVHLSNLFIEGEMENYSSMVSGRHVINDNLYKAKEITISHDENLFRLEFSVFNYANASNIAYEYRINGSKQWQSTGNGNNAISFNRLRPGTYKLEVKAVNNGNESPISSFTIHILPPWYQTTWAYLIYIILLISSLYGIYAFYQKRKLQELENDKTKVLFNATHDIRSPLTLIMSPLHKLQKREDLDDDAKKQLSVIERSANRILDLVNQILDLRKLDCQQLHLHCRKTNLVTYIQSSLKLYEYQAESRHINMAFTYSTPNISAWIDRQNFDKIINNLLSNAFKFTANEGNIEIKLSEEKDEKTGIKYAKITITDTGIGLEGLDTNKIFDRFYQATDSRHKSGEAGTGIGLNLCKMITEIHHGKIAAYNRTDTQGSIFEIKLPQGTEYLKPEEIEDEKDESNKTEQTIGKNQKPTILVVDDDPEIAKYIRMELNRYFNIVGCSNGKEAINLLFNQEYDLVVSDVMMPEMDGFTLLRLIKTNSNISHIPVIMLTSKSDVSNRLMGLEKGADAFLAKPFDCEELQLLIKNLINHVRRLKGKYSSCPKATDKVENIVMKSNDDVLMERIIKSINEHISEFDFGVEELAKAIGVSRAQLHRKMKDIAGIPASEFLRNIRLEQAARILSETEVNVAQVAYRVGFNSQSYFSTCFKRHFGKSPSEYAENTKKQQES